LPPNDGVRLVPSTPPTTQRNAFGWESLLQLAETYRPDVIELKLILEADEQRLLLARNRALPRVDAEALYRWNGLEGELPGGDRLASRPGQFTDWSLGVNFSVPLGLRAERAGLRSDELVIARDRALLDQQLHAVTHILAQSLRNVEVFYEQYELSRETREAARTNVNLQIENYRTGRTQFINALLAINDWGDAIQNEARFLAAYNVELANIERETGTILESHGVRFYEELQCALGPLGRMGHGRRFTATLQPTPNTPRYPAGDQPAENFFNLENPIDRFQSPAEDDAGSLAPPIGGATELLPPPQPPRRIP
jgi:outer membrane protein TolC